MVRKTTKDLTVLITEEFLKNWQPDFLKVKYIYVRDALVKNLLVSASKKGTHSFVFDYGYNRVHKSKVIGYWPIMTIEEARIRVQECDVLVKEGKSYEDLFEVERTPATIYFLENEQGYIKIGRSKEWVHRIKDQVLSVKGVRLIGVRPETEEITETKLHNLYAQFRQPNTEYFDDKKGLIKQLITQAIIYNVNDKQLSGMMKRQKEIIYT
jgi:hypothetical protein|tara:strand:+ start:327 stop:959 length:633 start_codon:yes stop_codon:yes gene_type:complete